MDRFKDRYIISHISPRRNPESADFILNDPDYYCNLSYTLFSARVPGK